MSCKVQKKREKKKKHSLLLTSVTVCCKPRAMGRIMQETMVATVLLLLCIYTAPSFQLPVATTDAQAASLDDGVSAVEVARKLWSDAKKLHRKLRRRSTVTDDSSDSSHAQQPTDQSMSSERSGSPNVTAPKYILELYRNLSNTSQETTQANTIRTLQTISKGKRAFASLIN